MNNEKRILIAAIILQIADAMTTYYSLTSGIGKEANPFLSGMLPESIVFLKVCYCVVLYLLYQFIGTSNEMKHYFNICMLCNIIITGIVVVNNIWVIA
ncbi:hypothetical protein KO361_06015 [Candidatus Woesearchaeota archaeon]|nr:hypothetical protein [Candidatus Woesearchaeota archaeon]